MVKICKIEYLNTHQSVIFAHSFPLTHTQLSNSQFPMPNAQSQNQPSNEKRPFNPHF